MLLTRLYLRNFRVYEDELDLELPPGLVGIFGPNGAGKSTLLEAILWTLWGKARTTKEQIRSAGVGGDCITEVEFEHEGHLYLVRRTLSGVNSTPRLEARCDGLVMSQGVRDAERYVESVLGMDDGAFRASVFAEQKQLAAFSSHSPAERLRLVLRLLGITPLDAARDLARKDARRTTADHARLRDLLTDVDAARVEADDAEARAAAAAAGAATEQQAAAAAEDRRKAAAADLDAVDRRRQDHEALVIEGRGARTEFDHASQTVTELEAEFEAVLIAADRLRQVEPVAADIDQIERELEVLVAAAAAAANAEKVVVPPEPPAADELALEGARAEAAEAAERLAGLRSLMAAASDARNQARDVAARSQALSNEADCPLCGQALGDAFEQVQAHRAAELAGAEHRLEQLSPRLDQACRQAEQAAARQTSLIGAAHAARRARGEWEFADRRYRDVAGPRRDAWQAVVTLAPHRARALVAASADGANQSDGVDEAPEGDGALGANGADQAEPNRRGLARGPRTRPAARSIGQPGTHPPAEGLPAAAVLAADVVDLRGQVQQARAAATEAERLRVRLERRSGLEASLLAARERATLAAGRLQTLREKVHALGFDQEALRRAAGTLEQATGDSQVAQARAHQATVEAAGERAKQEAAATRLADAIQQHAKLTGLESDARHLARVAELLAEFRNTVVASVGPRLAVQAAELFAELTDHEYDELEVDPETYELQITDDGKVYGLDRFSGSEIDLANLALRVAISEHVHLQSGGSIGLLVLDEVFGPLDEDRKARMLMALERLRGRFRQILVVTHDATIKEQLPNAIEVVKLPGRRATARSVNG